MKNIRISCVINYELRDDKLISQLLPQLNEAFDFNLLEEVLNEYNPREVTKEVEVEALKTIADMLLIRIKDANNALKEKMEN